MRVHQAMPGGWYSMEGLVGVSTFGFAVCAGARWGIVRTSTSRYVYVRWVLFGVGGVCVAPASRAFLGTCRMRPPVPDPCHHPLLAPAGATAPDHVDASSREQHGPR